MYFRTWHDAKNSKTPNGQSYSRYYRKILFSRWQGTPTAIRPVGVERDPLASPHECALVRIPDRFPPYQTCHRRFQEWVQSGAIRYVLEALAHDLETRGKFKLAECFIDATSVVTKKGAPALEEPSGARVRSSWQWKTARVFLSPYTRLLLAYIKSPLSKILSPDAMLAPHLRPLLGILRMTLTVSIDDWLNVESN
jgi:hypothetical protein